ncbi:MAG: hypothetical protein AAF804_11305 [Bacteroidota bacterium]
MITTFFLFGLLNLTTPQVSTQDTVVLPMPVEFQESFQAQTKQVDPQPLQLRTPQTPRPQRPRD